MVNIKAAHASYTWLQAKMDSRKPHTMINILGYLKDSNAVAHSVDSDIFYEVIHLPASFKTYINLYYNFFTGTH